MCDFNREFKNTRTELDNLKDYLTEICCRKDKDPFITHHPATILDQIIKLVRRVEEAIRNKEDFHLNYLFVIRCMGAIEALRWALCQNSDFMEGR
jgi:hypothetical protein